MCTKRNEYNFRISLENFLYPIRASKCAADASRPGCSITTSLTILGFGCSCLISFFCARRFAFNVGTRLGI